MSGSPIGRCLLLLGTIFSWQSFLPGNTFTEICLLVDSRSPYIDNQNYPSQNLPPEACSNFDNDSYFLDSLPHLQPILL